MWMLKMTATAEEAAREVFVTQYGYVTKPGHQDVPRDTLPCLLFFLLAGV